MGAAVGEGIVALAGVVGAIRRDASDLFVLLDLARQVGQDRRITEVAPGGVDGPDLQPFLVDP